MYRSIVALLLVSVAEYNALSISYKDVNYSVSDITSNGLNFRETYITTHGFGPVEETQYVSISVSANKSAGNLSIAASAIIGFMAIVPFEYPVTFLSSWAGAANWQLGSPMWSASMRGVAGLMSAGYLTLTERNSAGSIVNTVNLQSNPKKFAWLADSSDSGSSPDNNLAWSSVVGQPVSLTQKWTMTLTTVASNVVGVLSYANAVVGPKSLETVVSIQNYPYASSSNTLTLTMAVATAGLSASSSVGQTGLSSGSGDAQMWFSLSNSYYANGDEAPASVQILPLLNGTAGLSAGWRSMVSNFSLSATVEIAEITFGAGVASIIYDPSVGSGAPVSRIGSTSVGSSVIPAVTLTALLLLSSLF